MPNYRFQYLLLFFILALGLASSYFLVFSSVYASSTTSLQLEISPESGSGGGDGGGSSSGGEGSSSSGGGGGGGGGSFYQTPLPVTASVIFSGQAYPYSTVTLLKDAQIAATAVADADSRFKIILSALSGGNYVFSIYAKDNQGRRSPLLTIPLKVTGGAVTTIGNILIAPTIAVDKKEVKHGDKIAIFGQGTPNSKITITVSSGRDLFYKTQTGLNGAYWYELNTSLLSQGRYYVKSKVNQDINSSPFSSAVAFDVGSKNIPASTAGKRLKADLNGDGRVNLIDFSIAAFWYKRPLSSAFLAKEAELLNGDSKVDLVDFSILAFYWTG